MCHHWQQNLINCTQDAFHTVSQPWMDDKTIIWSDCFLTLLLPLVRSGSDVSEQEDYLVWPLEK